MQVQNPLHLKGALVDRLRVANDEAERTMEEGRGGNKVINSVREVCVKSKLQNEQMRS